LAELSGRLTLSLLIKAGAAWIGATLILCNVASGIAGGLLLMSGQSSSDTRILNFPYTHTDCNETKWIVYNMIMI